MSYGVQAQSYFASRSKPFAASSARFTVRYATRRAHHTSSNRQRLALLTIQTQFPDLAGSGTYTRKTHFPLSMVAVGLT
jgi:hypothetical protein